MVWVTLGAALGVALMSYLGRYSSARFASSIIQDMRDRMASHISGLPVPYTEAHHSGDLLSRLTNDVFAVENFLEYELRNLVYQPLVFAGAFTYLLLMNWKLLLLSIILMPASLVLVTFLTKPMDRYAREVQEHLGKANSVAQDSIAGMSMLKAFRLQEALLGRYRKAVQEALGRSLDVERRRVVVDCVMKVLGFTPFILCIMYGGYLAVRGQMTPGSLLTFIQLMNYLVNPASMVMGLIGSVRTTTGAARRLFEVLDEPLERTGGLSRCPESGVVPIEFANVSFQYSTQHTTHHPTGAAQDARGEDEYRRDPRGPGSEGSRWTEFQGRARQDRGSGWVERLGQDHRDEASVRFL